MDNLELDSYLPEILVYHIWSVESAKTRDRCKTWQAVSKVRLPTEVRTTTVMMTVETMTVAEKASVARKMMSRAVTLSAISARKLI